MSRKLHTQEPFDLRSEQCHQSW